VTDLVAGDSYKPFLVYNPSAQYRYIDMTQGSPIRDVDIQVFFLDTHSNYPQVQPQPSKYYLRRKL